MNEYAIRQVAYFVPDVVSAAREHTRHFSSGPYYLAEHIPLSKVLHRGNPGTLDHSSAYGQWGELMIEFVQQNNPGPSVFHDLFPEGSHRSGLHHVALIVNDLEQARQRYAAAKLQEALFAEMHDGFRFVMIDDVSRSGHMIELYEGAAALLDFYALVKNAARGWDGRDAIRKIQFS